MPLPEALTKKIPARACMFAADVTVGESAEGSTSVPITLVARTGSPVETWWWGAPVVHDFAGMSVRSKIPLDYRHNDDQPTGYAETFDASSGNLVISGFLTPNPDDPHDPTNRIIAKARAGVPYQASIYFDEPITIEELALGATTEVNGQTVQGPLLIFRTWTLRGVAVCLYGVDSNTDAELKFARTGEIEARLITKGATKMAVSNASKKNATANGKGKKLCNKLADQPTDKKPEDAAPAADAENKDDQMAEGDAPAAADGSGDGPGECECNCNAPDNDEGDGEALAEANDQTDDTDGEVEGGKKQGAKPTEGQRFLKAFGKMGGVWFAEGKTFAEAQALYIKSLEDGNKKLTAENAKLKKHADESLGDKQALSFSGGGAPAEHKLGLNLSAGAQRFANSIKLPGAPSNN